MIVSNHFPTATTPNSQIMADVSTEQHEREVIVVSSPKAGSGAGRDAIPRLKELLCDANMSVLETTSIDEMRERLATSQAEQRQPVVIAAGGDGTLALVADHIDSQTPLLPMPLGTENLLARYFGHTNNPSDVFETIAHGREHLIDAGRANGQLFLVMASCGFDAEVVRAVHLRRKGHINRLTYAMPTLRAMRRYGFPEIEVTTKQADGSVVTTQCRWAMTFNLPKYAGGLLIEPRAIGDDGQLDVITFGRGGVLSGLGYAAGVALGRHVGFPSVERRQATTIEITSERPVPYQLDGDYVGRLPLRIETLSKRVRLLLPTR